DLLEGVTLLSAKVQLTERSKAGDGLYRAIDNEAKKAKSVNMQFIPYYAWNNRERTDMTVWMPLSY
ncbi:MAG: hypothetical protein SNF60_07655, partial [Rikenellaceae bacterium]